MASPFEYSLGPEFLAGYKNALGAKNYGKEIYGSKYKPGSATQNFFSKPLPNFKGIDFATGKTIDLSKWATGFGAGTGPVATENQAPTPGKFEADTTSPTRGMFGELLSPEFETLQQRQSQRRKEENLYDALLTQQMFQSYIPAMERLAKSTRLTDYQLGLMADIQSPTRQQERAASAQQQMATATGAEAAMLNAVNQAAYNNAMANIAGLRSGMRRG